MGPRSTVFTLNDGEVNDENFVLPQIGINDLIGAPVFPSPAYFARPEDLFPGQKLTIRLNAEHPLYAQVFGYVAPKGQCILDLDPNECWMVPSSPTGYDFAHQGITILSTGVEMKTANIGGGAGHAASGMKWDQVPLFYENTSFQMSAVRYGEDDYGVYAAGVAVPTMTLGGALELLRSATSGDWRWVDELGGWDFMGSCFVNLPGLPVYNRTRPIVTASASVLEPERAMLVTFSGAKPIERIEDMGASAGHEGCSCKLPKTAAAASETIKFEVDDETMGMIKGAIAEAIDANNAAWEAKLSEALSPVNARLDDFEPIVLEILDSKGKS